VDWLERTELLPGKEKPERLEKSTVASISYIPPVFGCFMAGAVVNDLCEEKKYPIF
jgi:tRNA A37 threonylcarbamoyladenosine dehydratase